MVYIMTHRKHFSIVPGAIRQCVVITTVMLVLCHSAQAATLYRWVDENGNVQFSDTIPPDQVKQGHKQLNEQGIVVNSVDKAKDEAQLEKERQERLRQERLRAEEEQRRKQQAIHDRLLLDSYINENDIIRIRDRKVATIESTIRITNKNIESLDKSLGSLESRLEGLKSRKKPTDELEQEITDTKQQIADFKTFIEKKRREQHKIRTEYDRDLERFRELKAEQEN
jgi:hypothetical protein